MGKGRKNATSDHHDRLLSTFGYDRGDVRREGGDEFYEEGVFPTMTYNDESNRTDEPDRPVRTGQSSRTHQRTAYDEDHEQLQFGGLSLAFDESGERNDGTVINRHHVERHVAASAPVNVPELSKILRVDSFDSIGGSTDETEWVPPHEYLAREHGRSVTTSVFEGVGRTLKGRDMSRVRSTVWSQTGFFG
ncbi:uncharacterized protein M6B38_172035 [Iris pallida]|uniref:Senescence regulator n=1 Tax=Iris pallida TaxID=29817 RepID=A0AAX6EU12_IRIPA|nr:uncharacterized protein M6B38_172035 [Iris pallida]